MREGGRERVVGGKGECSEKALTGHFPLLPCRPGASDCRELSVWG